MQSIGKLVSSQAAYYTEQLRHSVGEDVPVLRGEAKPAQVDYYANHESPSRWMGTGLGRVGLVPGGLVDPEVFCRMMGHQTPAGEAMSVSRSHGRVAAFDHTFSAPKSVSLLYAFGDNRVRAEVTSAHQRAVSEAVSYMEKRCSQSRLGVRYSDSAGDHRFTTQTIESEGYVAAAFDHYTSRANDPQVHTHVVVINRVWAGEGWRAIDAKRAYAHAKAGGSVYEVVLRDELTRRLGVSWLAVVNGNADVAGFSPELIRHFSARRVEIVEAVERYLAEHGGEAHRRVWQSFTLETRQPKVHPTGEAEVTREMKDYGVTADIIAHWHRRAADAPEDVAALVRSAVGEGRRRLAPTAGEIEAAATHLVEGVADRQAVFTERDLVAQVSGLFPDGATSDEVIAATRAMLLAAQEEGHVLTVLPYVNSGLILPDGVVLSADEMATAAEQRPRWLQQSEAIRFRALPGETRYTTRIHLQREEEVLGAVRAISPVAADQVVLESAMTQRWLIEEQKEAIRHLAQLDGRVVAVVGPGGSGKTHSIGAYADAVQAGGHAVVGVATSAAAARKLAENLGKGWTGTIAMLRHHLDVRNDRMSSGTVLIVDEASMVSTKDLAWLVKHVVDCDGKVVLTGDPKQLPSVDSGGLFHRIVASGEGVVDDLARVNERQRLDFDRTALTHIREGRIQDAVRNYAEAGRLHLGRDQYSTKATMVDAWWADAAEHGLEEVRMLASRHDEVWMLNQLARARMEAADQLSGSALVNRWGLEFQVGDRVVVRDNWYKHSDLRNGQTGTVIAVNLHAGSLRIRRDLDQVVIELPKGYLNRSVDHGYAQTIHTAQGQTFEIAHVYADAGVRTEHGYTALSRARGETHIWINDAPGSLSECIQVGVAPLTEDRIDSLVRQLSQSVIEPSARDQGLVAETATDRQLIDWRDELEALIRSGPLAEDHTEQLAALDLTIDEVRQVAARLGTSGATAQIQLLERQREGLRLHGELRAQWLEDNPGILQDYTAVAEELGHRTRARALLYQVDPPLDLVAAIGPRPNTAHQSRTWEKAVGAYAQARLALGPEADLGDPAVPEAARWRDALSVHQHSDQQILVPILRRVG